MFAYGIALILLIRDQKDLLASNYIHNIWHTNDSYRSIVAHR